MDKQEHALSKKELFLVWNLLLDKYEDTCDRKSKIFSFFCYGNCDMGSKDKLESINQNELIELIDKVSTRIDFSMLFEK